MGWEKGGRYYTRSKRLNGRVVREYIGGGAKGEETARQDALDRQNRQAQRAAERIAFAEIETREAYLDELNELNELNELMDLLARAALTAAGYRLHRGRWRKQRKPRQEASPERGNRQAVTELTGGDMANGRREPAGEGDAAHVATHPHQPAHAGRSPQSTGTPQAGKSRAVT